MIDPIVVGQSILTLGEDYKVVYTFYKLENAQYAELRDGYHAWKAVTRSGAGDHELEIYCLNGRERDALKTNDQTLADALKRLIIDNSHKAYEAAIANLILQEA